MIFQVSATLPQARTLSGSLSQLKERSQGIMVDVPSLSLARKRAREVFGPAWRIRITPVVRKEELERLTPEEIVRLLS